MFQIDIAFGRTTYKESIQQCGALSTKISLSLKNRTPGALFPTKITSTDNMHCKPTTKTRKSQDTNTRARPLSSIALFLLWSTVTRETKQQKSQKSKTQNYWSTTAAFRCHSKSSLCPSVPQSHIRDLYHFRTRLNREARHRRFGP